MFSCHGSEAGNERSSVSTLGKSLHTPPGSPSDGVTRGWQKPAKLSLEHLRGKMNASGQDNFCFTQRVCVRVCVCGGGGSWNLSTSPHFDFHMDRLNTIKTDNPEHLRHPTPHSEVLDGTSPLTLV